MKTSLLATFIAAGVGLGALAPVQADVSVGDRRFEVLRALGDPIGVVGSENYKIYYFDRGEVVLRGGVVESHSIISAEEAERRRAAAEREREERLERERAERERRIAEGRALRDERLADPNFHALPATARFTFWQVFRERYPEVDIDLEYAVTYREARREVAERRAQAEHERRLQELEQRVREAEYQAERAEREAELARRRSTSRHYYDPVFVDRRAPIVVHSSPKHRDRGKRDRPEQAEPPPPPQPQQPARPDIRERLRPENFMFPPLEDRF